MQRLTFLYIFGGVLLCLLFGGILWFSRTSVERIFINDTSLTVRVADTVLTQKRGLSGYTLETLEEDGMLFRFSSAQKRTFWMKGMEFDLDILWIANNRIVAIERNVPAPLSRNVEPRRVSSDPLFVDQVLELPAGEADRLGILEGMIFRSEK